ncbi:MAG: 16S rRNA (guanine(527)-N(7))-methyltransferase RsmG [Deltaproteobacteria bacterium]|nr:16S rRNA (guanine(527)-N(7))-methyltransferase RsmG [Deltaproteobacteria bacterium]
MGHQPSINPNQLFEPAEARTLLERGTRALDLDFTPIQFDQFLTYLDLLLKWNRKINLTALRTPEDIISRHFLDSLLLLPYLPETGRLLDLGSGAGFPGLPLKIARPGLSIDLVEATAKKASFLKEAVRRLGLSGINVFPIFLGPDPLPNLPARPWEVFLSRGVNLDVVLKALEGYWGPAQRLLLMKGSDWREEIEKKDSFLKKQQVEVERTVLLENPLAARQWVLVILREISPLNLGKQSYYHDST